MSKQNLTGDHNGPDETSSDTEARLRSRCASLESALREIAALDPNTDSVEGFNEWGEADCFRKAQDRARAALKGAQP